MISACERPCSSLSPSACATAATTRAGSRRGASDTQASPSGKRSAVSAAACNASVSFPSRPAPTASAAGCHLARAARPRRAAPARDRGTASPARADSCGRGVFRDGNSAPPIWYRALRRREVLQPVLTQIPQGGDVDERARGVGQEHLPAVSGRRDPRRPVNIVADIALLAQMRGAGVEAHAHAERARSEAPADLRRRPRARPEQSERRRRKRRPACRPRHRRAGQTPHAGRAGAR